MKAEDYYNEWIKENEPTTFEDDFFDFADDYGQKLLLLPVVNQRSKLLAFVKEVSQLHYGMGLSDITVKAHKILEANCG